MPKTKRRVRNFSTTVSVETEVDVDIDADELHDDGWHHESECSGVTVMSSTLGAAIHSLHRQAHPSQARSVRMCHEEPCRSLTLSQLNEVDSA